VFFSGFFFFIIIRYYFYSFEYLFSGFVNPLKEAVFRCAACGINERAIKTENEKHDDDGRV